MNLARLVFLLFVCSAAARPISARETEQHDMLGDTSLQISLPSGWYTGPSTQPSISSTSLHYSGYPTFEIVPLESHTSEKTPRIPNTDLPWNCSFTFGVMGMVKNAGPQMLSVSQDRPEYVPEEYFSRVMAAQPVEKHPALFVCLDRGSTTLTLEILPAPEAGDGSKLTPVLQAIASASRLTSTVIRAHGYFSLPLLGVAVSPGSGAWVVGTYTGAQRRRDYVQRVSSAVPLSIVPFLVPGTCSDSLKNHALTKNPPYVSGKWEANSWEEVKEQTLQLVVCRQIMPAKTLIAAMFYGARTVLPSDASEISAMLDNIADEVSQNLDGTHPRSAFEACYPLDPTEVAAALSGPGTLFTLTGRNDQAKSVSCYQKRAPVGHNYDAASLRAASGPSLLLIAYDAGVTPLQSQLNNLPDLGDRAWVLEGPAGQGPDAPRGYSIGVDSGVRSFLLFYSPMLMNQAARDTAVQLAREVLAGDFRGYLTSHPLAEQALARDRTAVAKAPGNVELWNEIGFLSAALKKLDDARDAYLKISQILPGDPAGYYGVAVTSWQKLYGERWELMSKSGARPADDVALDPRFRSLCDGLKAKNRALIDQGYDAAKKALDLHPGSGNLASFVSLLAREKAATDCGDASAAKADKTEADHFVDVAAESRKAEAASGNQYIPTIEVPSGFVLPPPPPTLPLSMKRSGNALQPIHLMPGAESGLLVKKVDPVYPPLARQARVQGAVTLEAQIDEEGEIESLKAVDGHPFLITAAIEAVKQWKYKPYLLNGQPVRVDTTVVVNFTLSDEPAGDSSSTTSSRPSNGISSTLRPGNSPAMGEIKEGISSSTARKPSLIRNIAPEDAWKRANKCIFPANAMVPGSSYMAGTVEVGLIITPEGNVVDYSVRNALSALAKLAVHALRQWKFDPKTVQDERAVSRVRAIVVFSTDGTTSVKLARSVQSDDFGDQGIKGDDPPQGGQYVGVPQPSTGPQCRPELEWLSVREVDAN